MYERRKSIKSPVRNDDLICYDYEIKSEPN